MINITNPSDCSGCTACASICPRHCITMIPDGLGFLYPTIDKEACINCGLCENVCAFKPDYDTPENFITPIPFGARNKDIKEIEKSRSGAAFVTISDKILKDGGIVYGAGMDSTFRVVHKRATNKEQRDEFRGSKYVQSDVCGIFTSVAQDLKSGLLVLFSGTPCQTAGLQRFLNLMRIDKTNLFVCDIVCHGVPSPYIWHDYLDYIRKKEGEDIISVNFRDKQQFGWKDHKESFKLKDTYIYNSIYTYTFYQHIMFRHSCGKCHFTNLRRTGDITLADFWGWQNTDSTINLDDKGISLLLVNTPKGKAMLEDIKDNLTLIPTTIDKCLQPNLQHPSLIHSKRMKFENDYITRGFTYAMRKNGLLGWRYEILTCYKKTKCFTTQLIKNTINKLRK